MTPTVWKVISFGGIAVLLTQPDPQFWVMLGVLITSAAGLIAQRMNAKRDERRHQWEKEDRDRFRDELKTEVAKVAVIAVTTKEDIRSDIAQNTELTVQAGRKADQAYDAANHVNEKIQAIAQSQRPIKELATDTNDTAHRIEDKL